MKYYKIKYRYENRNSDYWVTRSGNKNNCGFVDRIGYKSRAMFFSEDALDSFLLKYYLAYKDYELIESSIDNISDNMIYHTAEELNSESFKNIFQTSVSADNCKYKLSNDIISGEWFNYINKLKYYKIKFNQDNIWIIYDISRGFIAEDDYNNGIIISELLCNNLEFLDSILKNDYCFIPVKKPWHFSKIYYDENDIR